MRKKKLDEALAMADQQDKDLVIDYALDLVDPDQREAIGRRLEADAELREEVALLHDVTADLTLLAAQVSPSSTLCAEILDRIDHLEGVDSEAKQQEPRILYRSRLLSIGGWVAAACLAVATVVLSLRNHQYRDDIEEMHREVRSGTDPINPAGSPRGSGDSRHAESDHDNIAEGGSATTGRISALPRSPVKKRGTNYRLQQDINALRDRVADLKRVRDERFQQVPGLARLTVVEMVPGDSKPETAEVTDPVQEPNSVGKKGDQLIAAATPHDFAINQRQTFGASGGIVLSNAIATGLVGLGHLDAAIFPEFTWSGASDFSVEVDPNFDSDTEVHSEADPALAITPIETPAQTSATAAYTIFDETTGQGSILVQNLPPSEDGSQYQLWMVDSLESDPINVGALPELERGGGHVFFELGEGGYSPSEFFITREPETGSDLPTGEPVLSGPQATDAPQREAIRPTE
jgi:anti-sigma-K factor RskA